MIGLGRASRGVLLGALILSQLQAGCSSVASLVPFRTRPCPESEPVPDMDTGGVEPVDVASYYRRLGALVSGFPVQEIARPGTGQITLPIFYVGPVGTAGKPRVLVVSAVHGNEVAASLAGLSLLAELRQDPGAYAGVELHVIIPANPVALVHQSRYSGSGCDVNLDFDGFRTVEAKVIREVLKRTRPDVVVSLGERLGEGFEVEGTRLVPAAWLKDVARSVEVAGIPLAEPRGLWGPKGYRRQGWLPRMGPTTLGSYANDMGVPAILTASPRNGASLKARVTAQIEAVRAVVRRLSAQRGEGGRPG